MPTTNKRLNESFARTVEVPKVPTSTKKRAIKNSKVFADVVRVDYWCKDTPGFGLRVSSSGHKTWVYKRRVNNKLVSRVLGTAVEPGSISADAARKLFLTLNNELNSGIDRATEKRAKAKEEKLTGLTFEVALQQYVKDKVRAKDGLPLKERTKNDYLNMIKEGETAKSGKPFADGPLFCIAHLPLNKITADHMRKIYKATKAQRTKIYSMQVLRAVLNWHGFKIEDNPLGTGVAGKLKIPMPATKGKPTPIPQRSLSSWWAAATDAAQNHRLEVSRISADGLRFMLLSGARAGEVFGNKYEDGLTVNNVDLKNGIATFTDTKNRTDHYVYLSTQAAEILKDNCKGKIGKAKVFDVLDPGKTLASINEVAGTPGITAHKLRHTFTSIADALVSTYCMKAMVNHINANDVTLTHYVHKSESQLRDSWQLVADFIVKVEPVKPAKGLSNPKKPTESNQYNLALF
jgi:integrase